MKKIIRVTLWGSLFTTTVLCSPVFSMQSGNLPLDGGDVPSVTRASSALLQNAAERAGAANLRRDLEVLATGEDPTDRVPVAGATVVTASSMSFDEEAGERGGAAGVDVLPQRLLGLSLEAQRALEKEFGAESAGEERIPSPRDVQDNPFHTPQDYEEADMRRAHAHLAVLEARGQFMRDHLNARAELRHTLLDKNYTYLWEAANRLCREAARHAHTNPRQVFERFERAMIHFEAAAERVGDLPYLHDFSRAMKRAEALHSAASAAVEAAQALEANPDVFTREGLLALIKDLYQQAIASCRKELENLNNNDIWRQVNSILTRRKLETTLAKLNEPVAQDVRASAAADGSEKEVLFHSNWMRAWELQKNIEELFREGDIKSAFNKFNELDRIFATIAGSALLNEQVQAREAFGTCGLVFARHLLQTRDRVPEDDPEYRVALRAMAGQMFGRAFGSIKSAYDIWNERNRARWPDNELEAKLYGAVEAAETVMSQAGFAVGMNIQVGELVVADMVHP